MPLLPTGRTWRFQRLVDFRAAQAVLQLWEDAGGPTPAILSGQVELRETRHEDGASSFSGAVQSAVGGSEVRSFSFHPRNEVDVDRQVEIVAEMWRKSVAAES